MLILPWRADLGIARASQSAQRSSKISTSHRNNLIHLTGFICNLNLCSRVSIDPRRVGSQRFRVWVRPHCIGPDSCWPLSLRQNDPKQSSVRVV